VVRTSPVSVEFDLLLHVPTRSAAGMVCACTFKSATPESSRVTMPDTMVRLWKCGFERVYAVGVVRGQRRRERGCAAWVAVVVLRVGFGVC
jgi:hypothetical protein